jgi:hypothetical protein
MHLHTALSSPAAQDSAAPGISGGPSLTETVADQSYQNSRMGRASAATRFWAAFFACFPYGVTPGYGNSCNPPKSDNRVGSFLFRQPANNSICVITLTANTD